MVSCCVLERSADPILAVTAGPSTEMILSMTEKGGDALMHQPWDALEAPRFTGPRTFARLPHVTSLEGAHAAVFEEVFDV